MGKIELALPLLRRCQNFKPNTRATNAQRAAPNLVVVRRLPFLRAGTSSQLPEGLENLAFRWYDQLGDLNPEGSQFVALLCERFAQLGWGT